MAIKGRLKMPGARKGLGADILRLVGVSMVYVTRGTLNCDDAIAEEYDDE
jgi:hypothetical protein